MLRLEPKGRRPARNHIRKIKDTKTTFIAPKESVMCS